LLCIVNLGAIDLSPHPVRADDLEHPDELRVDLDPGPGTSWDDARRVALIVRDVLDEHGLRGWPKTSGSRGMHVNVRIERRWSFDQVRRAALALAREVERRAPERATSQWWKEERHGGGTARQPARAVCRPGSRGPRRRALAAALQEASRRAAARRTVETEARSERPRERPRRPPVGATARHCREGGAYGGRARGAGA